MVRNWLRWISRNSRHWLLSLFALSLLTVLTALAVILQGAQGINVIFLLLIGTGCGGAIFRRPKRPMPRAKPAIAFRSDLEYEQAVQAYQELLCKILTRLCFLLHEKLIEEQQVLERAGRVIQAAKFVVRDVDMAVTQPGRESVRSIGVSTYQNLKVRLLEFPLQVEWLRRQKTR